MKRYLLPYFPFFVGLFAGLYFIGIPAVGFTFTHFPGDLGDARFNNYLLEHAFLFFTGEVDSFWNAAFMYPEAKVITYSDNLLGTAPFYALFRLAGFNEMQSFQSWYVLLLILNYSCCYALLRYLLKNNYAASCGAFLFAFSIALQSQIGHAQTFPRFMVPLALLCTLLFLKELRPAYFFLLVLTLVYQMYCGIYLGFMLMVPVGIMLLLSVFFRPGLYRLRLRDWRWHLKIVLSLLAAILLLFPLMSPYLERSKQTGFYSFDVIRESLPTLLSYSYSWAGSFFWKFNDDFSSHFPAFWDHQIFPGGIAIFAACTCLLLAVLRVFSKKIKWQFDHQHTLLLLSGLICFLFYLRVGDLSLYRILFHLPGFGAMRALQRIINIELVFFASCVAFLCCLLMKKNSWSGALLYLAVLVLLLVDNRVAPDYIYREEKQVSEKRVHDLIGKIGPKHNFRILSYEPDSIKGKLIYYQLDAMLASQFLQIKTLNGYSATSPFGYENYWLKPNEWSRKVWLEKKRMSDKDLIVVH